MFPRTQPVFLTALALAFAGLWVAGPAGTAKLNGKEPVGAALYHPEHEHLWNRLHSVLLIRVGPDGQTYGEDRLEPLLWPDSTHLLEGTSADRAVALLEEFLREDGELLIDDPLKQALLQRDLWLIFNWLAQRDVAGEDRARRRLAALLAKVIRRLALSPDQTAKLPDNYAVAVASKRFADRFNPNQPDRNYLPPDLLKPDGPWVCIGRTEGRSAPRHLAEGRSNGFTNSVFLVFLKFPAGRGATLGFLKRLAAFDGPLYLPNNDEGTRRRFPSLPNPNLPQWPQGTQVALMRRAMLIDSNGQVVASPLTESIQLRVMRTDTPAMTGKTMKALYRGGDREGEGQAFAEFQLRRTPLFAGEAGGLCDVSGERDFKTGFNTHTWDIFEKAFEEERTDSFPERNPLFRKNRTSCIFCHRFPGVYSFNSFHAAFPFRVGRELKDENDGGNVPKTHSLAPMPVEKVEHVAVNWKQQQPAWKALKKLLPE